MDDRSIIEGCQAGQLSLMETLFDRYKTRLYNFCRYLTNDNHAAEELFQDTWVKVLHNIHRCHSHNLFLNWTFAIAANLYKERYRNQKRRSGLFAKFAGNQQVLTPPSSTPEQHLESNEDKNLLRQYLISLDDKFRVPLILYYFKELSVDEIAEVLKLPQGTVKSRLHHGRKKLKLRMEVADDERRAHR